MGNTTADKLSAALLSKERIREAIEGAGVSCPSSVPFSEYGDKIKSIGSSGIICGPVKAGSYPIGGVHIPISYIGTFVKQTV